MTPNKDHSPKKSRLNCNRYSPDYQAMGDCVHCGRLKEDHVEVIVNAPPSVYQDEFWSGEWKQRLSDRMNGRNK